MVPQPLSAKSRVGAFCTPLQGWEASLPYLVWESWIRDSSEFQNPPRSLGPAESP